MDTRTLSHHVWRRPIYFIAFGFGSGLMPKAPGTWGTLAALPIYVLMRHLPPSVYMLATVLAFVLGVWVCDKVSRELGMHDYGGIVWDEIVGYLFTMFLAPPGIVWMLIGFGLFRLFDIWKPQPIGWIDARVHGGLGIMLDDAVAALPSWIILQLLVYAFA